VSPPEILLQAIGLTLWRGDACLFEALSFAASAGTALFVRGPNGAGKTTLLRVLCGLTRPEEGEVLWRGKPLGPTNRQLIAYGGHQPALKADLTVRQNLEFYARLGGSREPLPSLLEALGIERCSELEVRYLSAGQKRRAGLARVLMSDAPAWLLDEPFTNMDVAGRQFLEDRIAAHVSMGGLAVVVAHDNVELRGVRSATLSLAGA
jgi:heme exporter protein A